MMALRKLGVQDLGTTPDAASIQNASLNLNLLIKQMDVEGLKLWKNQEVYFTPIATQTLYVLGGTNTYPMYDAISGAVVTDRPITILQAWYQNTSISPQNRVPLQLLARNDYNILGSPGSQGIPNSLYYRMKTTYGNLHVYLTPDAYTAANLQIHLVCQMPLQDINYATDIADFPVEWMNCLVWNLADQMAIEYGVPAPTRAEIAVRANTYRAQLTDWDTDSTSTFFIPDTRSMVRSGGKSL